MKTRSFIYSMLAGVAVFTLASCAESVSEFFGLEDRELISFTATTDDEVSDLTRAAIEEDSRVTVFKNTEPEKPLLLSSSVTKRDVEATRGHRVTSATELSAFRVSSAIGSKNISEEDFAALAPNYFYNVKAAKNSNNIYEIERDYYWPSSDEKLWFYAYTPCDDDNVVISDVSQGGPQKVTFTVASNVVNQIDLMTADASSTAFTTASGETTKTSVALNFRHELTAIRFIIGEQWLAGSIKSIGIYNVHGKGTMTIGADDASKWEWKNKAGTQTYSATDDFVLTVNKGGLAGAINEQFIDDQDLYFLMIPQAFDDNNDAYVEVKYQDNAREYTVTAPLKGQSAWVRNTTVTYAISSHELTKLKVNSIAWPSNSGEGVWNGPKTDFVAGDEVGLYVVDPDGQTIQEDYRNVKCTFDGGRWTVNHPENHPVYKLPGYQYFFYYPYTPTPSTIYPVAGQNTTNTEATAFFSTLIDGWLPAASQNTQAKLDGQDLQVAKGIDDAQLSSTVNATMAHQMNLAKVKLGTKSITNRWVYPIETNKTWYYQPDAYDITASSNFSGNVPYLQGDTYYYVFKPVEVNTDPGTTLTAFKPNSTTVIDWSWEMKSLDRGKMLSHTAESSTTAQDIMHENELSIAQIVSLTATGSALTVPVSVLLNNTALTKGTHYTVSFKNSSNATVTSISAAGDYTAIFTPTGRYSGDAVSRAFTVNRDGKTITFGNTQVNKTYGDAAFTQAVTKTGTGTVTYSSGNTDVATVNSTSGQVTIKAAGSAIITATVADSDYDHYATNTASYTLTVGKKAVTVTASAQTVTYGTAITQGTAKVAASGLVSGHSVSAVTLTQSTTNATTSGTITPSAATIRDAGNNDVTANYNISYSTGKLTINKKEITITAKAQTVTYGTAISQATNQITVATLISGHSISALTLTPSTTNATTNGTITPSGVAIKDANNNTVTSNYAITYATGKLTINRKDLGTNSNSFKFTSNAIVKDYIWELNGYTNSTLTKPSDCTVTYTNSSVPGVATVTSSGVLTAGGTVGSSTTTTITVTATGNYTGTATYTIYAKSKSRNFSYNSNGAQAVTLPVGTYAMECWGAQGGDDYDKQDKSDIGYGGKGGYTYGRISFTKSQTLYVYVGKSGDGNNNYSESINRGGRCNGSKGGGGGSTDIRTVNGTWSNFDSRKSRIMVAAGGGGAENNGNHGGAAGGTEGTAGTSGSGGAGATQTTGYGFGLAQYDIPSGGTIWGAGGNGYWSGYSIASTRGGGGGSSFISGHSGCNAISKNSTSDSNISPSGSANHYSGLKFSSTSMKDGNTTQTKPGGGTETGHSGDGYARITWVSN